MNENITISSTINQHCTMHKKIIIQCIENIYWDRVELEREENLRGVLQYGMIPNHTSVSLDVRKINERIMTLRQDIKENKARRIMSEKHLKNLARAQRAVSELYLMSQERVF